MFQTGKRRSWTCATLALSVAALAATFPGAKHSRAVAASRAPEKDTSDSPIEETVADLAAGRVIIAVVKSAILVGTIENPIEAQPRPPVPVAMVGTRLGVI